MARLPISGPNGPSRLGAGLVCLAGAAVSIGLGAACSAANDDLLAQALTAPVPASIFDLDAGACFSSPALSEVSAESQATSIAAITSIELVDCGEPHRFQVVATLIHAAPAGRPFPGSRLNITAQQRCLAEFEPAVGVAFDESPDLELLALRPSEASWTEAGDRNIYCVAYLGADAMSEGSLLTPN